MKNAHGWKLCANSHPVVGALLKRAKWHTSMAATVLDSGQGLCHSSSVTKAGINLVTL